jgi:TonB family protein
LRLLTAISLSVFVFTQAGAAHAQTTDAAPPGAPQLAETNRKIRALSDEKKHAEAVQLAETSVAEAARLFGPDSTRVSEQLSVLAEVQSARGDKGKAKKTLARLLELREKRPGPSEKFEQSALEDYVCLVATDLGSTPERSLSERVTRIFVEDSVMAQGFSLSPDRKELRVGAVKSKPAPYYPPEAKQSRLSGAAVLALVIDDRGTVKYATPLGCTSRAFRAAAQEAALRVTFEPTLVNGKPVEVRSITFYRWVVR